MSHDDETQKKVEAPTRRCSWCQLALNPGQAHLTRDVCIWDLQVAFAQAAQVIGHQEATIEGMKSTQRLAWVMINAMEGKVKTFMKEEMVMPAGAKLTAEVTQAGMVVRAIVTAPPPGVPS